MQKRVQGRRRIRRRLSVAPASTPAASALQLSCFGLSRENLGNGKLLGGGDIAYITEPENFSKSPKTSERKPPSPLNEPLDTKTCLGSSSGSGPIEHVDPIIASPSSADGLSERGAGGDFTGFLVSFFLLLGSRLFGRFGEDFLGVSGDDWGLLVFTLELGGGREREE